MVHFKSLFLLYLAMWLAQAGHGQSVHPLAPAAKLSLIGFPSSPPPPPPLGNWLIYLGNIKLNDRWDWHHEIQHRNYKPLGHLDQLLLRTGLGYTWSGGKQNLLLGYGFIHNQTYEPRPGKKPLHLEEHRIFQQHIAKFTPSRMAITSRLRLEERFLPYGFLWRFRQFIGINYPLFRKELARHTPYLSLYNELFLAPYGNGFERNRLYAGIGYRFSSKLRCELGFLNQLVGPTARNQLNIILFVNL